MNTSTIAQVVAGGLFVVVLTFLVQRRRTHVR